MVIHEREGEDFFSAALNLYWDTEYKFRETGKCQAKKVNLATLNDLRAAFLPGRTKESVERACDKIARSANELFANSELFDYHSEPSCQSLGLDEKSDPEDALDNRCYFSEEAPNILVCDCPDGYVPYTPKDYAKEHVVKCIPGAPAEDRVHMHYSDYPEQLAKGYRQYVGAKREGDVSGMVLGCDAMINAVHMSGKIAPYFVKGGVDTLNALAEG